MNRPSKFGRRRKANRHVLAQQPPGYYQQEIPEIHMHRLARCMSGLKKMIPNRQQ